MAHAAAARVWLKRRTPYRIIREEWNRKGRAGSMPSQLIVICGIAPIIFLTAALIAYALMLRGQWDKLGDRDRSRRER
jgi:hypothetical protein